MPDTSGWQDIAFCSLNCSYSKSSLLVFQVKIFFRGKLSVLLKDFSHPVLTLGLDKEKENKSVIICYNLKFLMVNLQVERKQGLKGTEFEPPEKLVF